MESAKWYLKSTRTDRYSVLWTSQNEGMDPFGPSVALDLVSDDSANWIKAPMLQELHMDYLIQLSDESFYGPTTEEAVQGSSGWVRSRPRRS